jgi:hypothetical protein
LEPGLDGEEVSVRPKVCRILRVRFSLTAHSAFVDKSSAWSLGIPRVGFWDRRAVSSFVSSASDGVIGVGISQKFVFVFVFV